MSKIIWLLVVAFAFEAMIFANGHAFVVGFILAVIGILLEARKDVI